MPSILTAQITLTGTLNVSLQQGDEIYWTPTSSVGGFDSNVNPQLHHIGTLKDISVGMASGIVTNVLSIESPYGNGAGGWMPGVTPPNGSYLSFAKNRIVNNNNLLGYHGLIKFVNNSKEKVELFSVGSILTESSK